MSKKVVTVEQLLEYARQAEGLNIRLAQAVAEELAKRPTEAEVTAAIDQLFTSVSNGKSLIASAITDKGVSTAADATFQTMRDHILAIPSGDGMLALTGLAVAVPPDKTSYYYNGLFQEFFNPTGMTFTLSISMLGMSMDLPITPAYEAIDADRHKMTYFVSPTMPENMSQFPEGMTLDLAPDREVQEGDSQITATVKWMGQTVSVQQAISVAYSPPHWYDIEQQDRTWAQFEAEFDTWSGVESA